MAYRLLTKNLVGYSRWWRTNCSSQYRVVKNVESLSSLYSISQSCASVDASCESGLLWKLNVHHKADAKLQQGRYISLCPSSQHYLLSCSLLLSTGHVGGGAALGISTQHLRMTGHRHTWHYPIWALCLALLKAVTDADLELGEQGVCLADIGWLVLLHCSFNDSCQYIARITDS